MGCGGDPGSWAPAASVSAGRAVPDLSSVRLPHHALCPESHGLQPAPQVAFDCRLPGRSGGLGCPRNLKRVSDGDLGARAHPATRPEASGKRSTSGVGVTSRALQVDEGLRESWLQSTRGTLTAGLSPRKGAQRHGQCQYRPHSFAHSQSVTSLPSRGLVTEASTPNSGQGKDLEHPVTNNRCLPNIPGGGKWPSLGVFGFFLNTIKRSGWSPEGFSLFFQPLLRQLLLSPPSTQRP